MNTKKSKRLVFAIVMLLISAVSLSTASFAWFSMNTSVEASGIYFESYSDQLFLQISKSESEGYDYSVDFTDDAKVIRPVSYGSLSDENPAYAVNFVMVNGGNYVPPALGEEDTLYYLRVVKSDGNDSRGEADYILINHRLNGPSSVAGYYDATDGNITFTLQTSGVYTEGTYYQKVKNAYVPVVLNAADAENGTPADELYGYYQITTTKVVEVEDEETGAPLIDEETGEVVTETVDLACGAAAVYETGHLYYELREDGGYYPVGGLELGSALAGYYTVEAPESDEDEEAPTEQGEEEGGEEEPTEEPTGEVVATVADGETEYFIKNANGDYISIGVVAEGVALDESYTYWYRAYSNAPGDSQSGNVSAIIDDGEYTNVNNPYYLYETVYLRMEYGGAEGENLRVSSVNVHGSDSLTNAIRILFVATNGRGEVAYATFDNEAVDKISHGEGEVLFERILSGSMETVKVEMYVYYDGTSDSVKTGSDLVLSGHSISVGFSVDKPYYADYVE